VSIGYVPEFKLAKEPSFLYLSKKANYLFKRLNCRWIIQMIKRKELT